MIHYYDVEEENWVRSNNHLDASQFDQFMLALFWTLQTITTVGYGTIPLRNSLEKFYAIIIIIIGATIYSFIVGSISSSIHNSEQRSIVLQNNLKTLRKMSASKNLPKEITERVERFIKKNLSADGMSSGSSRIPLQKLLGQLPENLKIELINVITTSAAKEKKMKQKASLMKSKHEKPQKKDAIMLHKEDKGWQNIIQF